MTRDFKEAEEHYEALANRKRRRISELEDEVQDMSQFYKKSLAEGKYAIKGKSWLNDVVKQYQSIDMEFKHEMENITIPDEINPPQVTVLVYESSLPVEIKAFGHALRVSRSRQDQLIIECRWKFNISIIAEEKNFTFKGVDRLVYNEEIPSEFQIKIQPASYKDAYEALLASLEE